MLFHSKFRAQPLIQSLRVRYENVPLSSSARSLGVIFDDTMSFDAHLSYVCKPSFYHLRNISKIRKYLNKEPAATIVHAFVTSKLDYYLAKLDCYLATLDCYLAKLGCYLAKLDCYLACLSISHGGCIMSRTLQPEWCAKDVNTIILHQCYRNSIGCLSTRNLYSRFSYCIKILHRTIKEKNSSTDCIPDH